MPTMPRKPQALSATQRVLFGPGAIWRGPASHLRYHPLGGVNSTWKWFLAVHYTWNSHSDRDGVSLGGSHICEVLV